MTKKGEHSPLTATSYIRPLTMRPIEHHYLGGVCNSRGTQHYTLHAELGIRQLLKKAHHNNVNKRSRNWAFKIF